MKVYLQGNPKKYPQPNVTTTHSFKILPKNFQAVLGGSETFKIRKKDWNFKVDDGLVLREWIGKEYTCYAISKRISYIVPYEQKPVFCEGD
ncbi:MAG TPA: DUF3850 domain-containing protein [Rummeliibacillus sp.]|nr:DUF3850 domain-containing protein [Rummeliibacillus sp.]